MYNSHMQNEKKVIVVVGASRGIGRATALALAEPGARLVGPRRPPRPAMSPPSRMSAG
jgi:NAD(P)-dependent dehydrogenase (short-subunit alcohol dehydrogenase family)